MTLETPQGRADHMARSIEVFGRILELDELLEQIRARHGRAGARRGRSAARRPGCRGFRRRASSPSPRERTHDDHCRALGRLGADRLRQRPEARALRAVSRSSARSRRRCGRRRSDDWDPGRDLRARIGRGRRRALGPAPAGAAAVGAVARRGPVQRVADAVPAPRLLSRHGAAMGLDARALGRCRRAQSVRLYGRRHLAAERCGRAAGACRRVEEVGRAGQGECAAVGHGRPADPLDRRRCEQVHGARGAARAALRRHLARPAEVRPRAGGRSVAAGGESRALARRLPQAARRRTAASSC